MAYDLTIPENDLKISAIPGWLRDIQTLLTTVWLKSM